MLLTGYQLPAGTVLEVAIPYGPFRVPHPGILAYDLNGVQVVLHNSKTIGRPAVTTMFEFTESQTPWIKRIPASEAEGAQIVRNAAFDVARGRPWAAEDNCQDFVSRALTGRNGSPTQNGVLAAGLLVLAFWAGSR